MGVDKADVRTVIHRDCAPSVEAYLQEAGRAGRDGGQSSAFLLWGPEDEVSLARAKTEAARDRVSALLRYARDVKHCRRHSLLSLLNYDSGGETPERLCCDVCENKANAALREEMTVLDFLQKNKRRYMPEKAASVLARSRSIHWTEEEASAVIDYLLKTEKIKKHKRFPWKNKL
jgi:ATP-dependent DNA helicase RecQ